jgi:hypothetical protein
VIHTTLCLKASLGRCLDDSSFKSASALSSTNNHASLSTTLENASTHYIDHRIAYVEQQVKGTSLLSKFDRANVLVLNEP